MILHMFVSNVAGCYSLAYLYRNVKYYETYESNNASICNMRKSVIYISSTKIMK